MTNSIEIYPGNKKSSGILNFLINNTPEVHTIFELFAGSAAYSSKLYTLANIKIIVNELSDSVFSQLKNLKMFDNSSCELSNINAFERIKILIAWPEKNPSNVLLYLDPPYMFSTRKSLRPIYEHEFSDDDHIKFLNLVWQLHVTGYKIMISHYNCSLYNDMLQGFSTQSTKVMTRGGVVKETIYCNYDISQLPLLTYKYLGKNRSERQFIQRQNSNMLAKIANLPIHRREYLLQRIAEAYFNSSIASIKNYNRA